MLHMLLAQNAKTVFCFLQGHRVSLSQLFCLISVGQSSLLTFSFLRAIAFFSLFISGSNALVFFLLSLLASVKGY